MYPSTLLYIIFVATLIILLLLVLGTNSNPAVQSDFVALNTSVVKQGKERIVSCLGPYDPICKNGQCQDYVCVCNPGWITWKNGDECSYKQKTKLEALLLSLFVGGLGVDWFILARGNAGYIVAGVFKLLTAGGFGIWWIVDWARILADVFNDGNGAPLQPY
jgi:hypothetical protein